MKYFALSALGFALAFGCAPPKLSTPIADIPKLKTLAEVMDNQATVADPQFKKIGQASYGDEDFTAFAEVGERIQATSTKIKDFAKEKGGQQFEDLANQLNAHAKELAAAAGAKDSAAAGKALADMKSTCKTCHSLFR